MASLSPIHSFCQFYKSMLMRLAELYQDDFSSMERRSLEQQLDIYLDNVQKDERFINLGSLGDLARVFGGYKETSFSSFGLSSFEAMLDSSCCDCKCRKVLLCNEYCEDYFT